MERIDESSRKYMCIDYSVSLLIEIIISNIGFYEKRNVFILMVIDCELNSVF
jgi:uncharacterized membrane protein